jgi:isoleucyl-tRNA synthetase
VVLNPVALERSCFDAPTYRIVIVLGLVQDKNGQKCPKLKAMSVDPWAILDKQGATPVRWYFYTASQPWLPSRFSGKAGQ